MEGTCTHSPGSSPPLNLLKGGNIGIVEAQETRFGMSPKYSRYIEIAS